jgi:hypothetical protein
MMIIPLHETENSSENVRTAQKSDSVINSIPSATMKVAVTLAALAASVAAHGGLTFPPPRNNYRNIAPTNLRYVYEGSKSA